MGIAVSSSFKKQGIGRLLLTAIETWAQETGASGIRLVSGASRVDAHEFYCHCGYIGDKRQINLKKCSNQNKMSITLLNPHDNYTGRAESAIVDYILSHYK